MRPIYGSHMLTVMGALGLDGNSSLVFELEVTTYNYNIMLIWEQPRMKPPFHMHMKFLQLL